MSENSAALEKKKQGNAFLKARDFTKAVQAYTEAIELDSKNAVFYGNRAAAYMKLQNYETALADAQKSEELDPQYVKALGRQGLALFHLKRYQESFDVYSKAVAVDDKSKIYKNQLARVEKYLTVNLENIRARIAELPRQNVNDAEKEARMLLAQLAEVVDREDPIWLETTGRLEAFLGRICFSRTAWSGAYEHFDVALENLRQSKTDAGVMLLANFICDFLFIKSKLRKEITEQEVNDALELSASSFGDDSVRHAKNLEICARVTVYLKNQVKSIKLLATAIQICRKNGEDQTAQMVCMNSDKALSDLYYSMRRLDEAKDHQLRVIRNPCCKAGDKAIAQFSVATICRMKGEWEEGHKSLDQAIEMFESLWKGAPKNKEGKPRIHPQLPRMYLIRAELFLGEVKLSEAKDALKTAETQAVLLGLKDVIDAVNETKQRLAKAEKGELVEEPLKTVHEHEEDEYELRDTVNATSINENRTAPFKRTQLGPNMEFLGDGVENLFMKTFSPGDKPKDYKPPPSAE